jgi:Tol biopolymer transport system component
MPSQVYTVDPAGGGVTQLTHVAGDQAAAAPAWSSDGKRIVYESNQSGSYEIWVMNANGSGQTQLTHRKGFEAFLPHFSPDGQRIVFSSCGEPAGFPAFCDIDVMNADGSGVKKLLGGHRYNLDAEFSPSGKTIAFQSDRAGILSAIWRMSANGSSLRRLTPPRLEGFWPDWAPGGGRLLFTDNCCRPGSNLWSVGADGKRRKRLTHFGPRLADRNFAGYSPDGRRIAFNYCRSKGCQLFALAADGTAPTLIPGGPSDGALLLFDWGPAG